MKKKKKYILWGALCLVLAAAWIIRYATFNQWVIDHYEKGSVRSHPVGELVPLGDNYLGKTSVKGYSIRVEGVRIVDAEAYYGELRSAGEDPGEFQGGAYKICEVELYIENEDNAEEGLSLFSVDLTGRDFYARMNTQLFAAANFKSGENEMLIGVKVLPGKSTTMKVPYACLSYQEKMGRTLETEPLWLLGARYPEEVRIQVQ